ncbi:hypothetical protein L6R52_16170 [Myxococcota bacterium]|nr:hypothetical protein [Myxococcota bacterium]
MKPPSQPSHGFTPTTGGLMERYSPPVLSNAGTVDATYTWNREKKPTSMTRPDAPTVLVGYDGFGRASSMTVPPRSAVGVTYDAADRVQTVTTPGNQVTYTYEGFLPSTTTWTGEVAGVVYSTYAENFRLSGQEINSDGYYWYLYDADGLLTQVQNMALDRDTANGLLEATTIGAVDTTHGWTSYGEASSFASEADGDALYAYTLGYDGGGHLTSKTEPMLGVTTTYTYGYDALGRLETVHANGVRESEYVYDGNGNRLEHRTSTGTITSVYDAQDRLLTSGTTACLGIFRDPRVEC